MSKALDSGKSFIQQLAARLPEASRAAFLAQFDGQEDALTFAGDAALARPEFSKAMNDLKAIEATQKTWWETHKEFAEIGQKAKAAGFDPVTATVRAPSDPPDGGSLGLTEEDLNKRLNEREMGAAAFFSTMNRLSLNHFQQFNEVLDTDTLTREAAADPQKRGLVGVYTAKYADRIAAKAKEASDADFNKRYEERRREELKNERNRPPDTISAGPGDVSPLDALTQPTNAGADVQELVDMYHGLVAVQK